MLSGGIRHWIPKSTNDKGETYKQLEELTQGSVRLKSKRKDDRNLLTEAAGKGYSLAFNKNMMESASGDKLLGLFSYSGMADGIVNSQTKNSADRSQPTLEEMTEKALSILEKDEDGFFLMVEGGQIDWAAHSNDAGTMLHEMIKFDDAVNAVYEWAKGRDDTIIIVTADHETGSFGFSYSSAPLPEPQKRPGDAFKTRDYKPNFNFGSFDILDGLYNQKLSYYNIFEAYGDLPEKKKNAKGLMEIVNANSDFPITEEQAERVLKDKANPYHAEGHSYLKAKMIPALVDFDAFFPYNDRGNVLAREHAHAQNTVWGTGTHTHTPVNIFAWGPADHILPVSSIMHHSELGQFLKSQVE